MDALRTAVLVALALFAAGYALWVARWFLRGQRTAGGAPESGGAARDHRQKPLYDATSKPSDANRCHRFGKRKRGRKSRYICRSKCA